MSSWFWFSGELRPAECPPRPRTSRASQAKAGAKQNPLKRGGLRIGPVSEILEHLLVLLRVFLGDEAEPGLELLKEKIGWVVGRVNIPIRTITVSVVCPT